MYKKSLITPVHLVNEDSMDNSKSTSLKVFVWECLFRELGLIFSPRKALLCQYVNKKFQEDSLHDQNIKWFFSIIHHIENRVTYFLNCPLTHFPAKQWQPTFWFSTRHTNTYSLADSFIIRRSNYSLENIKRAVC